MTFLKKETKKTVGVTSKLDFVPPTTTYDLSNGNISPSILGTQNLNNLMSTFSESKFLNSRVPKQKFLHEKSFKICFMVGFSSSDRILSCISEIRSLIYCFQKAHERNELNTNSLKIAFLLYCKKGVNYSERFKVIHFSDNFKSVGKRISKIKQKLLNNLNESESDEGEEEGEDEESDEDQDKDENEEDEDEDEAKDSDDEDDYIEEKDQEENENQDETTNNEDRKPLFSSKDPLVLKPTFQNSIEKKGEIQKGMNETKLQILKEYEKKKKKKNENKRKNQKKRKLTKQKKKNQRNKKKKIKKSNLDLVEALKIISRFDWKSEHRIIIHVSEKITLKSKKEPLKYKKLQKNLNESVYALVLKQIQFNNLIFSKIQKDSIFVNLFNSYNKYLKSEKKQSPSIRSSIKYIGVKEENFTRKIKYLFKIIELIGRKKRKIHIKQIEKGKNRSSNKKNNDNDNDNDKKKKNNNNNIQLKKNVPKSNQLNRVNSKVPKSNWIDNWTEYLEAKVYFIDAQKTNLEGLIEGTCEPFYKVVTKKFSICKKWFDQGTFRRVHHMIDEEENKFVAKVFRTDNQKMDLEKMKKKRQSDYLEAKCKKELIAQFIAKQFAKKFNSKKPFKTIDFLQGFYCKFDINLNQNNFNNSQNNKTTTTNNNNNTTTTTTTTSTSTTTTKNNNNQEIFICNAEPFLEGRYIKYCNNYEMKLKYDKYTTIYSFPHFTYHESGKKLMIVDLQGVGNVFTDPAIHSVDRKKRFNSADLGEIGIKAFFDNHICSLGCKKLNLPKMLNKIKIYKTISSETSQYLPYEILCSNVFCSKKIIISHHEYQPNKSYYCTECVSNLQQLLKNQKSVSYETQINMKTRKTITDSIMFEKENKRIKQEQNGLGNGENKNFTTLTPLNQFQLLPQSFPMEKLSKLDALINPKLFEVQFKESNLKSAMVIPTTNEIPSHFSQYYFEVKILNAQNDNDIGLSIGFIHDINMLVGDLGKINNSLGYNSGNGTFCYSDSFKKNYFDLGISDEEQDNTYFYNNDNDNDNGNDNSNNRENKNNPKNDDIKFIENKYGPQYNIGDTIGVCLDRIKKKISFTLNGNQIGIALKNSPLLGKALYPAVSFKRVNVTIQFNFGNKPFLYNYTSYSKSKQIISLICPECKKLNLPTCKDHGFYSVILNKKKPENYILKNIQKPTVDIQNHTNKKYQTKIIPNIINRNLNISIGAQLNSKINNFAIVTKNEEIENFDEWKDMDRFFEAKDEEKKKKKKKERERNILYDIQILHFTKNQIKLALNNFPVNQKQINHIILQCPTCSTTIFSHDKHNNLTQDIDGNMVTIENKILSTNEYFKSPHWNHLANDCDIECLGIMKIRVVLTKDILFQMLEKISFSMKSKKND
ncbi:eukaryotic elongation factor 2 kinase [Anaeramoeba flamelloides]|uniref:Eukaryotic elongation factor 2 kinase n=1 Tax=Anaeramoeba flamelloides TaxID=1746091 RepID=A0ABQ8YDX1_9EUKA|nr:eukaryotic elongation factor 2 kinase [Anaeramoeba flamelloides]